MKTFKAFAALIFIITTGTLTAQNCYAYGGHRACREERMERRDRCHDRRDLRRDERLRREFIREGDYRDARLMSRDIYYDRQDMRRDRW